MKKLIDILQKKLKIDKKSALLIITGAAGVAILVLSQLVPFGRASPKAQAEDTQSSFSAAEYEQDIENRLCSLISSIDGAGSVKVMITLESTDESVYATEEKRQQSENSASTESKYKTIKSNGSESGMLIKVALPQVRGVAVVCGGAGSAVVRRDIISAVCAVLGISPSKVSVTAMKSGGE